MWLGIGVVMVGVVGSAGAQAVDTTQVQDMSVSNPTANNNAITSNIETDNNINFHRSIVCTRSLTLISCTCVVSTA